MNAPCFTPSFVSTQFTSIASLKVGVDKREETGAGAETTGAATGEADTVGVELRLSMMGPSNPVNLHFLQPIPLQEQREWSAARETFSAKIGSRMGLLRRAWPTIVSGMKNSTPEMMASARSAAVHPIKILLLPDSSEGKKPTKLLDLFVLFAMTCVLLWLIDFWLM